jgi:hypothetical protein
MFSIPSGETFLTRRQIHLQGTYTGPARTLLFAGWTRDTHIQISKPQIVIDGDLKFLGGAQVALRGLDGGVPE